MKRYISLMLSLVLVGTLFTSCGRDVKDDTLDTNNSETSGMTDQTSGSVTKAPDSESETRADTEDVTEETTDRPEPLPVVDPFADYTRLYDDTIDLESVIGDTGMKGETVEMIFDDDVSTKWCVRPTAEDGSVTVQWALTNPETLIGYAFITANDSPDRNPDAWTLSASSAPDGDWVVLSEITGGNLPQDVYTESEIFTINTPAAYQYYKLHITNNLNERDLYQFSELVLLTK
ncbi:MAG: hypothetical protein IJA85_06390 [Clostridia bacterium]|nr:hypothetical protein [Clostridia bacterium]